jgi:hypothetical protein
MKTTSKRNSSLRTAKPAPLGLDATLSLFTSNSPFLSHLRQFVEAAQPAPPSRRARACRSPKTLRG